MVRLADNRDGEAVYGMLCELENKVLDREAFDEIYEALSAEPGHKILLWEEEGKVCGMLHLRMEYQLHHVAKIAEIMEFLVQERCRMGGIGERMFAEAKQLARDCGCEQLEVCSNQLRRRAHHFYEKQGMKNFHYKLLLRLNGETAEENAIGV